MNAGGWFTDAESAGPRERGPSLALHASRLGMALGLAVLTYLLFPASPAVSVPIYEVGSVASANAIAPFAFRIFKTPAEMQADSEDVARRLETVYNYVPAALDSARIALFVFGSAITPPASANPDSAVYDVHRGAARAGVPLTAGQAAYLADPVRRSALLNALKQVFDRWLPTGVATAGALDSARGMVIVRFRTEERRIPTDSVPTFASLVGRARLMHPDPGSSIGDSLYTRLLATFFHPTIVRDRTATELRRREMLQAIPLTKFEVLAGEKIIGANEVVGRDQHDKLRALHDVVDNFGGVERGAKRIIGSIAFDFLLIALLGLALGAFRPSMYLNIRWLWMVAIALTSVLIGAAAVAFLHPVRPELVPIALAAIIISALFDRRISVIATMVLATLLAGQSVYRGTNALFVNLMGGAVAAITVGKMRRRNQSYQWILTIGTAYVATAVAIGLTLDLPPHDILVSAGLGVLNALACVVVALLLLPVAESFTGIETDLTLLEWSDLNRPLMQRLSVEAPGTYAHTISIANLAEAACRAIGANGLLARVGAYYHDIGKIAKPQYFVENQPKGRNPHDALAPLASAQIIRDHVRAGLDLADEHQLPRALRAFITEHHGTNTISYFLDKAQRAGQGPDAAEYTYPGPIPQSAETAVVMLADAVEASARVLREPTPERIRVVVEHIVHQRIEQGQLTDAPLTLRQIETIQTVFARVLMGMYHNRVEYPSGIGVVTSKIAAK
ncbi:MAG: HDIG domain-containing metalloprotein [bacterium]